MNKKLLIQFYKTQLQTSQELKAVAMQNHNLAARLESEASSALKMLGASLGRTRKGKNELSDEVKISLLGNLTK
jgi:hypothetical protein